MVAAWNGFRHTRGRVHQPRQSTTKLIYRREVVCSGSTNKSVEQRLRGCVVFVFAGNQSIIKLSDHSLLLVYCHSTNATKLKTPTTALCAQHHAYSRQTIHLIESGGRSTHLCSVWRGGVHPHTTRAHHATAQQPCLVAASHLWQC